MLAVVVLLFVTPCAGLFGFSKFEPFARPAFEKFVERELPPESSLTWTSEPPSGELQLVFWRWLSEALDRGHAIGTKADPVMLEVFNNLFMSIAEQMGVTLQNTAYSVNIKERLDFSCAVFGPDGSLVANAPHMPVHLGSMDRSVETVIALNKGKIF